MLLLSGLSRGTAFVKFDDQEVARQVVQDDKEANLQLSAFIEQTNRNKHQLAKHSGKMR